MKKVWVAFGSLAANVLALACTYIDGWTRLGTLGSLGYGILLLILCASSISAGMDGAK